MVQSVTKAFLKALARGHVPRPSKRGESKPQRLSQSTIARTYTTVRHKHVAKQANAHLPPAQQIEVSPHILRHTLLRKVANEKGVHYAMELSGRRSDRYIWRYVRPDVQGLAEAIDDLD